MTGIKVARTERIRILLRETEDSIELIRSHLPDSENYDGFVSLGIVKDGIYKRIEYALQNIFDICVIINRDMRLGVPDDDDDIIRNLVRAGVIDPPIDELLREMKGFRNILVHQYGRIDDTIAYEILTTRLDDLISLCAHFDNYLNL